MGNLGDKMGLKVKFGGALRAVMLGLLVLLASCQSSTYENRSTKDENVVTATGKAAEVAAGANTSHNCPSCSADEASGETRSPQQAPPSKAEESVERITDSAIDTFSNNVEQVVNEQINDLFKK
jgi:cytoskeletal protein RodZ